jgi:chorismate synthase
LPLCENDLLPDLRRRRPGQSKIVTQRKEEDTPEIWSGVCEGKTDGTSIAILFHNADQRSQDYSDIRDKYRPGHADFTFDAKYGFRDYRGGGRSSARETVCRVAAGAVAKKLLAQHGMRILGYVKQVGEVNGATISYPFGDHRQCSELNHVRFVSKHDIPAKFVVNNFPMQTEFSRQHVAKNSTKSVQMEEIETVIDAVINEPLKDRKISGRFRPLVRTIALSCLGKDFASQ